MEIRPYRPIEDEQLVDLQTWFPEDRWKIAPPPDLFEIALVLSGGQSAGCYLAGVVDFLFEALDCWRDALRAEATLPADQRRLPNHRVRVKIIVGASAGGLTAGLAAICTRYRFAPASHVDFGQGDQNLASPFYRAWVRDVDIRWLLTCDDLTQSGGPLSLLNTNYLVSKVKTYLNFGVTGVTLKLDRDWVDDPLPVKVTVSNVEGVPYRIRFTGGHQSALWMSLHRDHLAFLRAISSPLAGRTIPDHDVLSPQNSESDTAWSRLGDAILSTIAFPFALQQRVVSRPSTDYEYRYVFPFAPEGLVFAQGFPDDSPFEAQFVMIDGGIMNARPFDLAHDALAGTDGQNVRDGDHAKRAVIIVDPFPSPPQPEAAPGSLTLPSFVIGLLSAFVDQGRFDPIDVSLAEADDVYSRFIIAPSRHAGNREIVGNEALASYPLRAFMGYFSEHYRHHDFMLGRRNCQKFLRDSFVLPSRQGMADSGAPGDPGNDLFASWPLAALANLDFRSQLYPDHRPIIPLLGSAARLAEAPVWPAGAFAGFSAVEADIKARLKGLWPSVRDEIVDTILQSGIGRWLVRMGLNLYFALSGRGQLLAMIRQAVDAGRDTIDKA